MTLYVAQAVPFWRDASGGQVTQFITLKDQSPAVLGDFAAVLANLEAVSDMASLGCWVTRWWANDGEPSSGPYSGCRDRAQFIFRSAEGMLARVNVPGPKASIFLTDSETVDLSNADVEAFLDSVYAACADTHGNALVSVHSAKRVRVRTGILPY